MGLSEYLARAVAALEEEWPELLGLSDAIVTILGFCMQVKQSMKEFPKFTVAVVSAGAGGLSAGAIYVFTSKVSLALVLKGTEVDS